MKNVWNQVAGGAWVRADVITKRSTKNYPQFRFHFLPFAFFLLPSLSPVRANVITNHFPNSQTKP
jgi:hypothetical protein